MDEEARRDLSYVRLVDAVLSTIQMMKWTRLHVTTILPGNTLASLRDCWKLGGIVKFALSSSLHGGTK